jgi:two-component system chemotaxis response regulator CheY
MAKVLIVDDAKIMRANVRKMLEKLGHEIVGEAENGFQSIGLYEDNNPDFVTMDITMPEIQGIKDGIDAVVEIRKIDYKAKIIMVTSHGEQDKVIKAIQAGASNYILKPLKIEKLEEVIEKLNL